MSIGEKFKLIRKELNISQSEMASKLGIKQSYYSAIERGENEPSENVLKMLFENVNINSVWFYEDRGNIFNLNPLPKDSKSRELELKKAIKNYKHDSKAQKQKLFADLKLENEKYIKLYESIKTLESTVDILFPVTQNYFHLYDPEDTTALISYFSDSIGIAPYEEYKNEIFEKMKLLLPYAKQIENINKEINGFLKDIKDIDKHNIIS